MKTRKIFLIVLVIIALLPCMFYSGWYFYSYKFRQNLINQIRNSFTFYYKDYKIYGFPTKTFHLVFVNPVFYIDGEINKARLTFEELKFTKKFGEDFISVQNEKKVNVKINGEKFSLDGVKNADILFDSKKEDYVKLNFPKQDINLYSDEDEAQVFEKVECNLEKDVVNEKNKKVKFYLSSLRNNSKIIEQDLVIQWDSTKIQPEYDLEIKKVYLQKDNLQKENLYSLQMEGRAKIFFTYRYNMNGEIFLNIRGYHNFFDNLLRGAKTEKDKENIKAMIQFLEDSSEINGENLKAKLHGDGEKIFLGKKNIDEIISEILIKNIG